jgi:flagellar hook assembly protein FlgD
MTWDGLDDAGRLVSDGHYYYEIVVVDERNRPLRFSGSLTEIRTSGPTGKIEIRPEER